MKKIIPVLVIILGVTLLGYPFISEYLFEHRVDSEISTYSDSLDDLGTKDFEEILSKAKEYNVSLTMSQITLTDPFLEDEFEENNELRYDDQLNINHSGFMGYVEIPAIDVYLPVYHGTDSEVLTRGIGHLEGTSLPVGGDGTHSVLTGHTGMNRAKLFTDLCELQVGDQFYIHVLNQILAYEVRDINVVLPHDTSKLLIRPKEDLVTLITCTPYGVNTHRLLVTGKRVPYVEKVHDEIVQIGAKDTSSMWMASYRKAVIIGLVLTCAFFTLIFIFNKARRKKVNRK